MNIAMLTNTYLPHVGGVARSVESFTGALCRAGHRVVIVAPTFEDMPEEEDDVIRVPAIQRFNGSDFSVRLPVPGLVATAMEELEPHILHSHHPFLLGDTALRIAALRDVPLVFTHHTMYERYTHYVPADSPVLRDFAVRMVTEYANLCHQVIAPSESVERVLRERGVSTPIAVVPTGIDPERFAEGDRARGRRAVGLDEDAFVVGHVGRLAPEKNLPFLARAVARFIVDAPGTHFLVVGDGPSGAEIQSVFEEHRIEDRLHRTGRLQGGALADAYHAMDGFAFASQTETQGMVLAEAMTAAVPVIAVDAPGAREVLRDGRNGRLLARADEAEFAAALRWLAELSLSDRNRLRCAALDTAEAFSLDRCAERLLAVYGEVIDRRPAATDPEAENAWTQTLRVVELEWNLWTSRAGAAVRSMVEDAERGR